MKRAAAIFGGLSVLLIFGSGGRDPGLVRAPGAADAPATIIDPHWQKDRCELCHPKRDDGSLDTGRFLDPNARANCDRCHPREALNEAMHHPYDIEPGRLVALPAEWPLEKGRLTCLTCHEIVRQCDLDLKERWRNPSFLRSEPGEAAVEFCLRCHPKQLYQSASPHDQLDDQGRERDGVCLLCHAKRPDPQSIGEGEAAGLKSPIVELCGNCHGTFPHPMGIPHLAVVKEKMLDRMAAWELSERYVIPVEQIQRYIAGQKRKPRSMPLAPGTHMATCMTCHNPHEVGVLPPTSPLARGAEGDTVKDYRLRYPKEEICSCCHRL